MEDLEYNTWYWITHPHEGDTWYPIFVNDNFEYLLNGEARPILELKSLVVKKAVMPH